MFGDRDGGLVVGVSGVDGFEGILGGAEGGVGGWDRSLVWEDGREEWRLYVRFTGSD